MLTDVEIAGAHRLAPIEKIAGCLGVGKERLDLYGKFKAKLNGTGKKNGKLILVTAVNPTPAGEGKTTVSVGLADGLKYLGKNVCLALREPSLGPVFGIKGGAAGGGYCQVVPMEDINLHFNGDIHAVTAANNLLSALIDNHIKQGNELGIERIVFKRCMDMNDRTLRGGFNITAASEIMAILCLSRNIEEIKTRLGRIIVGYNSGGPVLAKDLKAENAMAILLKEALRPNLVQTLYGTPALIHGGPFANIAHGCNSIIATGTALSYADYVVTEAGFGADLGAEKFIDIKCRYAGIQPSAAVLVVTARALKYNGGADNMKAHIENLTKRFNVKTTVAINRFSDNTQEELECIISAAEECGVKAVIFDGWSKGAEGAAELAAEVLNLIENSSGKIKFAYELTDTAHEKIEKIAKNIYGAGSVRLSEAAMKAAEYIDNSGYKNFPVCVAKTQYSFSADPGLLGRPRGFELFVRDIEIRGGAGFFVAVCGDIMLMPGLSKHPAAENMKIDGNGKITGLF